MIPENARKAAYSGKEKAYISGKGYGFVTGTDKNGASEIQLLKPSPYVFGKKFKTKIKAKRENPLNKVK